MKTAKIKFENGSEIITSINGTDEEIKKYYLGKMFNLGDGENDLMVKAVFVEVTK